MKRKILIALSLVAGVALLSLAADSPRSKPDEGDTIRELRAQITELRGDVDKLRERTRTLESSVEDLKRSPIPSPLNLQSPAPAAGPSPLFVPQGHSSRPPTVWGEREVNGWTFYIVPCEQQSR